MVEGSITKSTRAERRSWIQGRRKWIIGAGLLVVLIALGPTIVAKTPLCSMLVSRAVADLNGEVQIASADLGWFSGNRVNGVEILDADGQRVATIKSIELKMSLWELLWSRDTLGEITIVEPKLTLVTWEEGSNVESLAQAWLDAPESDSDFTCTLNVVDGSAVVTSRNQNSEIVVDNLQASITAGAATEVSMSARLWRDLEAAESGTIELTAAIDPKSKALTSEINTTDLALEAATAFCERLGIELRSAGTLSGTFNLQASATLDRGSIQWAGVDGKQLVFAAPQYLGRDQPTLSHVTSSGTLSWEGQTLHFESCELDSDLVNASAQGDLNLGNIRGLLDSPGTEAFEFVGTVDAAATARQLPNTLKLRDGVQVRKGVVDWVMRSGPAATGRRLLIDLSSDAFVVEQQGRTVPVDQPFRLSTAIRQTHRGPELEFVTCRSAFLTVDGGGSFEQGQITVTGDLNEIRQKFGEFLTLDLAELTGSFGGTIQWQPESDERITVNSPTQDWEIQVPASIAIGTEITCNDLHVAMGDSMVLHEPSLVVSGRTSVRPTPDALGSFDGLTLVVTAGEDRLEVKPLTAQTGEPAIAQFASISLQGDLQRWLQRAGLLDMLPGYEVAGAVDLTAQLAWNSEAIGVTGGDVTFAPLAIQSPSFAMNESRGVGTFSVGYNWAQEELFIETMTLATSSASLGLSAVQIPVGGTGTIRGEYAVRGDLARLRSMLPAGVTQGWECQGQLVGGGKVSQQIDAQRLSPIGFDFRGTVEQFYIASSEASPAASTDEPTASLAWNEERVRLEGQGSYAPEQGLLSFPSAEISGATQSLVLGGSMQPTSASWQVNVDGRWVGTNHPWFALLAPWFGEDAELKGAFDEPFSIHGPLGQSNSTGPFRQASASSNVDVRSAEQPTAPIGVQGPMASGQSIPWVSPQLRGNAGLAWQSGRVLGLAFGTGVIRPQLTNQVLDFGKVHVPLQQGDLRLTSKVSLEQPTPILEVEAGRILDRVVLTPQLSRRWLAYVAPLFADVASTEGIVSLDVAKSSLPLDGSAGGQGAGTLHIERAVLGPGPLASQLLTVAGQIKAIVRQRPFESLNQDTWLELPEQKVQFNYAQGRIHHDRLVARIGEYVFATSGSVGQDESLNLVVSIPIQDDWLQGRAELAALKGLVVQVPVGGTFSDPKIDSRALGELSKKLIQQATGQLLDQQIQRGLNKLFGGQE